MRTFTPIVITSKKARHELNRIKAHTSDIMNNIEEHKKKVASYHEGKKIEAQMMEEKKAKERAELQAQLKEQMAQRMKERELEIKRAALNG